MEIYPSYPLNPSLLELEEPRAAMSQLEQLTELAHQLKDLNHFTDIGRQAAALYDLGRNTGLKPFLQDKTGAAFAAASDILEVLESRRLTSNSAVKLPLARAARLFLDLTLWQALTTQDEPPTGWSWVKKALKKTEQQPFLREETADELRKSLRSAKRAAGKKGAEIALRHELQCCEQVIKALPTSYSKLKGEYCVTIAKILAGGIEDIGEGVKLIGKLRSLLVKGWLPEVLYLYWTGMVVGKCPQLFGEVNERIQKGGQKEPVALCGVGIYADLLWEDSFPYKERCMVSLETATKHPLWAVRYYAVEQLSALRQHSDLVLRERTAQFFKQPTTSEPNAEVRALYTAPCPVWNVSLRMVEPPSAPDPRKLAYEQQQRLLQQMFVRNNLEDPLLLEFAKQNPTLQTLKLSGFTGISPQGLLEFAKQNPTLQALDLSGFTGISPQGFKDAVAQCPTLEGLLLTGHHQITPQILCEATLPNLKHLNLTGHPLTDEDLSQLLATYPRLETLVLTGCQAITGHALGSFQGHSLGIRGTQIESLAALRWSSIRTLDISGCPPSVLGTLKEGTRLQRLVLGSHLLGQGTLTPCTALEEVDLNRCHVPSGFVLPTNIHTLDLEEAQGAIGGVIDQLSLNVRVLSLRGCQLDVGGEVKALLSRASNLQKLDLSGCGFTDWKVDGFTPNLPELTELVLDYKPHGNPSLKRVAESWSLLVERSPKLERLSMDGSFLTSQGLIKVISSARNLVSLKVTSCPTDSEAIVRALINAGTPLEVVDFGEALAGIKSLDLSESTFADRYVNLILAQCRKLNSLNLSKCRNLTVRGLRVLLKKCSELTELKLEGCTGLLDSEVLDLSNLPELSDRLLRRILDSFPEVAHLDLSGNWTLTDDQIAQAINRTRRSCHVLNLSGCSVGIEARGALMSAGLLRTLILQDCDGLLPADLEALAKKSELEHIDLTGCSRISEATYLNLGECRLLKDGLLQVILQQMPNLHTLCLNGCTNLTVLGLSEAFHLCPSLTSVDLSGCSQLARQNLVGLMNALPNLEKITLQDEVLCKQRGTLFGTLSPQSLPLEPSDFVGREQLSRDIIGHLLSSEQHVTALVGIGGVGKSTLAQHVLHQQPVKQKYPHRYWFRQADDEKQLKSQFLLLAKELNCLDREDSTPQTVQRVLDKLEQQGSYLLVFDNALDLESIRDFLPRANGYALITARDWINGITVPVLASEEAFTLTQQSLNCPRSDAEQLTKALDYHPLGINVACAYIRETQKRRSGFVVGDFMKMLGADALTEHFLKQAEPTSNQTLWRLTLEALSAPAKTLLSQLAYLEAESVPNPLVTLLGEPVRDELIRYGWIQQSPEGGVAIHRVLQLVVRQAHGSTTALGQVIEGLVKLYWAEQHKGDRTLARQLLPHGQKLIEHCSRALPNAPDLKQPLSHCLEVVGSLQKEVAQYREAKQSYEGMQAICKETYPSTAPELRDVLGYLASVSLSLGDLVQANQYYRERLTLAEKAYQGPDRAWIVFHLVDQGNALRACGDKEGAEACFRSAVNKAQNQHFDGYDLSHQITYLLAISDAYKILGSLKNAQKACEKAFEVATGVHNGHNPYMSHCLKSLGSVLRRSKDMGAALACFVEAYRRDVEIYGEDHPQVGEDSYTLGCIQRDLGCIQRDRGALEDAKRSLENALRIHEKLHGNAAHFRKIDYLVDLSITERCLTNLSGAKERLEHAVEESLKLYPGPNKQRISYLIALAAINRELGEVADAKACLERALNTAEQVYGEADPFLVTLRRDLGRLQGFELFLEKTFQRLQEIFSHRVGRPRSQLFEPETQPDLRDLVRVSHTMRLADRRDAARLPALPSQSLSQAPRPSNDPAQSPPPVLPIALPWNKTEPAELAGYYSLEFQNSLADGKFVPTLNQPMSELPSSAVASSSTRRGVVRSSAKDRAPVAYAVDLYSSDDSSSSSGAQPRSRMSLSEMISEDCSII